MPKRSAKYRLPQTSCRASDSPDGRLASASTHIDPTGTNRPSATFSRIRSNSSGWSSSIHPYWAACEQAKRYSG